MSPATHRPCGACRAFVGPEGCEHWRPHRSMLASVRTERAEASRHFKNLRQRVTAARRSGPSDDPAVIAKRAADEQEYAILVLTRRKSPTPRT